MAKHWKYYAKTKICKNYFGQKKTEVKNLMQKINKKNQLHKKQSM